MSGAGWVATVSAFLAVGLSHELTVNSNGELTMATGLEAALEYAPVSRFAHQGTRTAELAVRARFQPKACST